MKALVQRATEFVFLLACILSVQQVASASPFGQGVFGANVPFGSATSLSISYSGDSLLKLVPNGNNFSANTLQTVTVTSTDVVGYNLYMYASDGTSLKSGTDTIPAVGNVTPGALQLNTWGYNTDGSALYAGVQSTPQLIKEAAGPYTTGDSTVFKYRVLVSIIKAAGVYTAPVVYTVVAMSQ